MSDDIYQQRYLAHMERKRRTIRGKTGGDSFWAVLAERHSQRTFNNQIVCEDELSRIYEAIRLAPSSCNRQAIVVKPICVCAHINLLESLLVGGVGWLDSADYVLLLFADMKAYKSPAEVVFMPYLDAGFVAENIYLAAEALGLGACYVNPNVRGKDKSEFDITFNPLGLRFCGAMALGRYNVRGPIAPKRPVQDIFYPEGEDGA